QPLSPYVAILGGAKVGDKIQLVRSLLQRADTLLIGGAMAYTFLKALGHQVGASLLDEPHLELASQLLQEAADQGKAVLLPSDHLVASQATPEADVETCGVDIPEGRIGLDIGPESVARYQAALTQARMIVWNGPMGMFELPQFREGTFAIARAAADSAAMSLVGGGDSVAAVNQAGVAGRISHISTGGGASLEFLEGKSLPGIEVLTESGSPA
ncbi:MAG: phosphoglycerate kinase, partial [SAR324 cluster bacterium]|nr:phosphoglycerate kinase [SAR324 cluster bacterium]